MQLIAHRGLTNKDIKENTLEAFKNALNHGYDGIELDIRYTKDKKIVILHDSFINRTSNGKGKLNEYTYKELKKYNFGTNKIQSKIPLLKDIITKISNTIIFIELKENIDKEELYKILNLNKTNRYYICSFNKEYLNNYDKKYNVGIINNVFNTKIDLNNYNFIMILEDILTEEIYNKYKNNNIEVVIYGTLKTISVKNKEIISKIKYII